MVGDNQKVLNSSHTQLGNVVCSCSRGTPARNRFSTLRVQQPVQSIHDHTCFNFPYFGSFFVKVRIDIYNL